MSAPIDTQPEGLLTAQDIHVSYGGLKALAGASVSVPRSMVTALIGANGAGKTTLVDVLTGFIKPTSGTVRLNDRDITALGPGRIGRLGVVRVFQEARAFRDLTAVENVLVGFPLQHRERLRYALDLRPGVRRAERAKQEEALEILARVGLAEKAEYRASQLSYGQQKLLDIGRALAAGAQVLVLDEPSAGASPIAVRRLEQTITSLAEGGFAVLLVEHNIELIRNCSDRVAFMAQGAVSVTGTAEEVLSSDEVSREYLGIGAAPPQNEGPGTPPTAAQPPGSESDGAGDASSWHTVDSDRWSRG
jgi:branched-chain amino acid transport system ATP-binding protein